jgi:hypothetical protein
MGGIHYIHTPNSFGWAPVSYGNHGKWPKIFPVWKNLRIRIF